MLPPSPIPSHVPREVVRDFNFADITNDDGGLPLCCKRLHEWPGPLWPSRNDDHRMVSRADNLEQLYKNCALFSSRHMAGFLHPQNQRAQPKRAE